jgi:hypothetical protein
VVRIIGPGFHPDTDPREYVRQHDGSRLLKAREARLLAFDLARAAAMLGRSSFEAISLETLWQLLGVRYDGQQDRLISLRCGED